MSLIQKWLLPALFIESLSVAAVAQTQTSVFDVSGLSSKNEKSNYNLGASLLGINYFSESPADSQFQQQVTVSGRFKLQSGDFQWAGEALLGTRSEANSHYQAIQSYTLLTEI